MSKNIKIILGSIYLIILILTFSCGTKRVIYNNKTDEPKKEVKAKKKKPKNKKTKQIVIVPKILNTEDYVKFYSNILEYYDTEGHDK